MRVILADPHLHAREALRAFLEDEPDFELVGDAVDVQGLLQLAEKQPADMILLDEQLPGEAIEALIDHLHRYDPKPIVIVMSSDFTCRTRILQAGADSFVSKVDQPDWLIHSLHQYLLRYDDQG